MTDGIELHECTVDDWQDVRAVRLAALADAPHAYGTTLAQWEGASEARWRERFRGVPLNVVAQLDGATAGLVCGVPEDNGAVGLISMWVAPFARGGGVGDRLIAAVVRWARERGATAVSLDVVTTNAPAIALYRRSGFVDAGPSTHCEIDGVPQRAMIYRLDSDC